MKPLPEIFVAASKSSRPALGGDFPMRLGLEVERRGGFADDALDLVVRRGLADRDRFVRRIRDAQQQVGLLGVQRGQFAVECGDLVADRLHLRRLFRHVAALRLDCADFLAGAIALALQRLAFLQDLAPLFIELQNLSR